jgi:diguanylate cyclase (GGDEF)-like protein
MPASFATELASRPQRALVAVLIGGLTAIAGGTMVIASEPLTPIPAFLPFFAAVVLVTDILTAYVFASQFRVTRLPALAALTVAYLYSGLITIPHLLSFPQVVTAGGLLGGGSQGAVWLWVFWHGGFPLLILIHSFINSQLPGVVIGEKSTQRVLLLMPFAVVSLVTAMSWLALRGQDYLPTLVVNGSFRNLSGSATGVTVLLLNILALASVVVISRLRSVSDLGLLLAMSASLLDAGLTLKAGARFSLGWYVARINSMIASGSVLVVFLYEVSWLYRRVADLNEGLSRLAFIDELTSLANRRQYNQRVESEWARALRDGTSLALIMIDVDFFKKFNDLYGHPAGDQCLRQVARAVAHVIRRPADLAVRYGGEEFAVILPNTDAQGALRIAHEMKEAVRELGIRHDGGTSAGVVTISAGLAVMSPAHSGSLEGLQFAADQALYAAKAGGRNRTSVAAEPAAQRRIG